MATNNLMRVTQTTGIQPSYYWDASVTTNFSDFYDAHNIATLTAKIIIEIVGTGHVIDAGAYTNMGLLAFNYGEQQNGNSPKTITVNDGVTFDDMPDLLYNVRMLVNTTSYLCTNPAKLLYKGLNVGDGSKYEAGVSGKIMTITSNLSSTTSITFNINNGALDGGLTNPILSLTGTPSPNYLLTINLTGNRSSINTLGFVSSKAIIVNINYSSDVSTTYIQADFSNLTNIGGLNTNYRSLSSKITNDSNIITGTGTSGQVAQFNGTKTITGVTENTAFNQNFETSTSNIKMNGSVSVGALSAIPRSDHIHPVDTSRNAELGTNINAALNGADTPSAINPFVTILGINGSSAYSPFYYLITIANTSGSDQWYLLGRDSAPTDRQLTIEADVFNNSTYKMSKSTFSVTGVGSAGKGIYNIKEGQISAIRPQFQSWYDGSNIKYTYVKIKNGTTAVITWYQYMCAPYPVSVWIPAVANKGTGANPNDVAGKTLLYDVAVDDAGYYAPATVLVSAAFWTTPTYATLEFEPDGNFIDFQIQGLSQNANNGTGSVISFAAGTIKTEWQPKTDIGKLFTVIEKGANLTGWIRILTNGSIIMTKLSAVNNLDNNFAPGAGQAQGWWAIDAGWALPNT